MLLKQMLNMLGKLTKTSKKEVVQERIELPKAQKVSEVKKEERTEVLLMDLNGINFTSNLYEGKEAFKITYKNPVKIYPYMVGDNSSDSMSDDSVVGDAEVYVKNNKVFANIKLEEPFAGLSKKISSKRVLYKPFGYINLLQKPSGNSVQEEISVDFIYVLF
ncbi:MAG: hypothetical protein EBU90_06525 [Proteobacteria bacterium]|nr:hypothetical protein [Pseudomonadota bacterium]